MKTTLTLQYHKQAQVVGKTLGCEQDREPWFVTVFPIFGHMPGEPCVCLSVLPPFPQGSLVNYTVSVGELEFRDGHSVL